MSTSCHRANLFESHSLLLRRESENHLSFLSSRWHVLLLTEIFLRNEGCALKLPCAEKKSHLLGSESNSDHWIEKWMLSCLGNQLCCMSRKCEATSFEVRSNPKNLFYCFIMKTLPHNHFESNLRLKVLSDIGLDSRKLKSWKIKWIITQ